MKTLLLFLVLSSFASGTEVVRTVKSPFLIDPSAEQEKPRAYCQVRVTYQHWVRGLNCPWEEIMLGQRYYGTVPYVRCGKLECF